MTNTTADSRPPTADRIDLSLVARQSERIASSLRTQARELVLQGVQLRVGRERLARMPAAFDAWLSHLGFSPASAELLIRCGELFHDEAADHFHPAALLLLARADTPAAAIEQAKRLWAGRGLTLTASQASSLIAAARLRQAPAATDSIESGQPRPAS